MIKLAILTWRRTSSLLLGVVVVALLIAGAEQVASLRMAATSYRVMASLHANKAQTAERVLLRTREEDQQDWLRRLSQHHRMLEQKNLEAASRPWSIVPPDPEAPEIPIQ